MECFFVGYHARQGTQNAVLDHTWSSTCVTNVWLNEFLAGEYTLNAAVAGHYNVPVIMVSGDQTACSQIEDQLGKVEKVIVKTATGRYSAECLSPQLTSKMIEKAAYDAVKRLNKKDSPKPYTIKTPVKITVELASSDMADKAMLLPGVTRDERKLSFTNSNILKAYADFRALVSLSYPR